MNKNMKKWLSLLLVILILIPNLAFASNTIDMKISNEGKKVSLEVYGEKNRNVSISIKDENRYYLIDQGKTDEHGYVVFKIELDYDKEYEALANIDGNKEKKNFILEKPVTDGEDEKPGDSGGKPSEPEKNEASLFIKGYKGVVLDERGVKISPGESVLDFTTRILDSKGISYENQGGYIASIDGMKEFDKGKDSGWMYNVNGIYPKDSAANIKINHGDKIEWRYTYDLGEDLGENLGGWKDTPESEQGKENIKEEGKLDKDIKEILDRAKSKNKKDEEIFKELEEIKEVISRNKYRKKDKKDILKDAREISDFFKEVKSKKKDKKELKQISENIVEITEKLNQLLGKDLDENELNEWSDIFSRNLSIAMELNAKNLDKLIDTSLKMYENKYSLEKTRLKNLEKTLELDIDEDIRISKEFLEESKAKEVKKITINSKYGKVTFRPESFDKTDNDVFLSMKEISGGINLSVKDGKKELDKLQYPIRIEIPQDKAPKGRFVVKAEDGTLLGGVYSESSKSIIFMTTKTGKFKVVDNIVNFKDLDTHIWAKDYILDMASKGIIKGVTEDTFEPARDISRAEFVSLVNRAMQYENKGKDELKFEDVSRDSWYYEEVLTMYNKGIVKGRDEKNFDPNGKITREEVAKIIGGILKEENFKLQSKESLSKYKDRKDISTWSEEEIAMATEYGILEGNDLREVKPKDNATRAEAAVILSRFYELILKN